MLQGRDMAGRPVALIALLVTALVGVVVSPLIRAPGDLPGIDAVNLYAWEVFTRSAFAAGRLPFWNPHFFSGSPHFADPQTTVLYPPALLLRWLPIPAYLSAMAAVHMLIAGLGGMFLVRVAGAGWFAAAAAAVALSLGGSVGPWLHDGHLLLLYSAAWLPWAMACTLLSLRRHFGWPHPSLVAVCALQFLTGYLQGTVYTAVVLLAIAVFATASREDRLSPRLRPLLQLAIAGICTAALVAFQLLPTGLLARQAGRTLTLPYETAAEGGWYFRDLIRFVRPQANLRRGQGYRELADSSVYAGWILTFAAPLAFLDRERRRMATMLAMLALGVLAMASAGSLPFYRLHYAIFPGLRIPGRMLFITTASVATLGALGVDVVLRWLRRRTGPTTATVAGSLAIAAIAVDLLTFAAPAVEARSVSSPPEELLTVDNETGGRVLSVCENRVGPAELIAHGRLSLDGVQGLHLREYADWAYLARVGDRPPGDGAYRRIDSERGLPARLDLLNAANTTTVIACERLEADGLERVAEADGLWTYRNLFAWPRAIWTCEGQGSSRTAIIDRLLASQYGPDRRLTGRWPINVRWLSGVGDEQRRQAEQRYGLTAGSMREPGTWRYMLADATAANVNALLDDPLVDDTAGIDKVNRRVADPSVAAGPISGPEILVGDEGCFREGTVSVLQKDGPDGRTVLQVESPADGLVIVSEPYYVERRAYVDGKRAEIRRANVAWTAISVPAGRHRVELRYVPMTFFIGAGISMATLVSWVGLAGWRRWAS
jgi:hypothetical protein